MARSPGAWLELLGPRLDAQAKDVQQKRDYYDGLHKLTFATAKFKAAFAQFFPPMADNWMKVVVDVPVERLEVQGFRFDPDPAILPWDVVGDDDAWAIWQVNNLDSLSVTLHTEAVKCGKAYTMVAPGDPPKITVEHPTQVYVETAPGDRRQRLAALKRWTDTDGYAYANLFLPNQIHKFRSSSKIIDSGMQIQWARRPDDPGGTHDLGIPVIPIENNPDMLRGGTSDLDVAIPIQDAVNKLCLDMQVSSEYHAFPQRTATGWDVPRDADGNVDKSSALKASQAAIWVSENKETAFGQLEPGQVDNYIKPIELYIRHLAAQTRTPPHYLLGEIVNASGDALKAAETGLAARCKRKTLDFSDGWEDTMRLAFKAAGDTERANATQAETLWGGVESQSIAQLTDAAVKWRESLSAPLEMCWLLLGWSPQQIKQAKSMMNLPATPPPPGSNGGTPTAVTPPAPTP